MVERRMFHTKVGESSGRGGESGPNGALLDSQGAVNAGMVRLEAFFFHSFIHSKED